MLPMTLTSVFPAPCLHLWTGEGMVAEMRGGPAAPQEPWGYGWPQTRRPQQSVFNYCLNPGSGATSLVPSILLLRAEAST